MPVLTNTPESSRVYAFTIRNKPRFERVPGLLSIGLRRVSEPSCQLNVAPLLMLILMMSTLLFSSALAPAGKMQTEPGQGKPGLTPHCESPQLLK